MENNSKKEGWFSRLTSGLKKTSNKITESLTGLVTKRKLDQAMLDNLHDALISTDMGITLADHLIDLLKKHRFEQDITITDIKLWLANHIESILRPVEQPLSIDSSQTPNVVMIVGVNGAGKTTTIGKMASEWQQSGLSVSIVAADTFRAAAINQIAIWAERANVPLLRGQEGADSASLAFDGLTMAKKRGDDIMMIDTAGRLHTKTHLMDELSKMIRVLQKLDPQAPHHTLLVLDGTTGQNAINQVSSFLEKIHISGLIITKLDGTAKGGIALALAEQFKLPIYAIGVGEKIDDVYPFDARAYAHSLVGLEKLIDGQGYSTS